MTISELLAEMEDGLEGTTAGPWAIDRYGAGQRVCAPSRKGFNGKPFRVADAHFSEGLADTARMPEAADNAAHIARCSPDNIARITAGYREMEDLLRDALAVLESIGTEADEWSDDVPDAYHPGVTEPGHSQAHAAAKFSLGDLRRARALSEKIKKEISDGK